MKNLLGVSLLGSFRAARLNAEDAGEAEGAAVAATVDALVNCLSAGGGVYLSAGHDVLLRLWEKTVLFCCTQLYTRLGGKATTRPKIEPLI